MFDFVSFPLYSVTSLHLLKNCLHRCQAALSKKTTSHQQLCGGNCYVDSNLDISPVIKGQEDIYLIQLRIQHLAECIRTTSRRGYITSKVRTYTCLSSLSDRSTERLHDTRPYKRSNLSCVKKWQINLAYVDVNDQAEAEYKQTKENKLTTKSIY